MTNNEWGELFDDWGSVAARDAYAIGAGISREWPVWRLGYLGVEGQLLLWLGEQDHVELTLPVFARTPRTESIFVPSLAYGGGISIASEPSETEIARTGSSDNVLAHWFFEIEFGSTDATWRPYIRLHHRSDAWGTFDADTGSNAVLLGLRFDL